jgi:hypothetical protein
LAVERITGAIEALRAEMRASAAAVKMAVK